jgi:hypothetical protein
MRFLKSFLEEAKRQDTTTRGLPKLTEPPPGPIDTTLEELTKPTKPSSVSPRTLVYDGDNSAGKDEVLRVFPSAEVIQLPRRCNHCSDDKRARVVKRTWPDGRWDWMCHRCGREVKP